MPTTAARVLGHPVGLQVVMVQEYAEAGPLQQGDAPMGESLAQYYFRQMVDGLAYLHGAAVVHGDMKPDNVLLSGTGLVKIADFGQAHFFNEGADVFDKTLGTPAFMAPEVRSGGAYRGKPADMWALGVTLYCFLFADLPFKASSPHACCLAGRVCSALLQPECLPLPCRPRHLVELVRHACCSPGRHPG
jgi:[calcium/calmodulin-dependent protein kinase] kinase